MAGQTLRWGILSTGNIARQFAQGVAGAARSKVVAVASRDAAQARAFAQAQGIANAYGAYEAVLADPAIEAVYIGLPNTMHHEWTLKALRAGKHVLCEKPLAMSVDEGREMYDTAQRQGRVLIEAFMYLCHPLTRRWVEMIRQGRLGQVKYVRAGFSFFAAKVAGNIRFDPRLGGGALMDVGCYCLSAVQLAIGEEPADVQAMARRHETGVDEWTAGTLRFPCGAVATFQCGLRTHADNTLMICGDAGYLLVPIPWKPPQQQARCILSRSIPPQADMTPALTPSLSRPEVARSVAIVTPSPLGPDGPRTATTAPSAPTVPVPEEITVDSPAPLYGIEADAFAATVLDGAAPFLTPDISLRQLRTLARVREACGMDGW